MRIVWNHKIALRLLTLLGLLTAIPSQAAPGDLDPAFGAAGKVSLNESGTVSALALQSNGKLLLLKGATLMRLQADGAPDHSFSPVNTGFAAPRMVVQADDKILIGNSLCPSADAVLPYTCYSATDVALMRLNADGSLDSSFGVGGEISPVNLGASFTGPWRRFLLQADGKILIVAEEVNGFQNALPGALMSLIRLNSNGSPDTSFGSSGQGDISLAVEGGLRAAVLQTDGKILLANNLNTARFLATGVPDTSFGNSGLIALASSEIRLQADGKMLLRGSGGLYRYLSTGVLDSSFGSSGSLSCSTTCSDFLSQPNGKLLTLGSATNDFTLRRYTSAGVLDSGFGVAGVAQTDLAGNDQGLTLLLQADGRIVAAGSSLASTAPYQTLPLARYLGDPAAAGDLAVSINDGPDPIASSSTLSYTVHVSNLGSTAVSAVSMTDTLPSGVTYVSTTPSQGSCSGSATIICSLGAMAAGAHATVLIQVQTGLVGTLINTASVSGGIDPNSSNNTAAANTKVENSIDLSVPSLSASPSVIATGSSVTVTYTVKNSGTQGSASSSLSFYLSTDALWDAGDASLGTITLPAIAAGGSLSSSTPFSVTAASGNYQILAKVDPSGSITESNELNNVGMDPLSIVDNIDIVLASLSLNPAQTRLFKGSNYNVSKLVTRGSSALPKPVTLRLFLSADQNYDATADIVLQDVLIDLTITSSDSADILVTIPATMASGTYYLGAIVDFYDVLAETNEGNNRLFLSALPVLTNVDLRLDACTTTALTTAPGGSFLVSSTVSNQGAVSTETWRNGVYRSSNTIFGDADDVLIGQSIVPALAAGASTTGNIPATMPSSTTLGSYYLFCKADPLSALLETEEGNNNSSTGIAISVGAASVDLTLPVLTPSKTLLSIGDSFTISDTVQNVGTLSTTTASSRSSFTIRYYLSSDSTISAADRLLGSRSVLPLLAGASSAANTTVKIPLTTPPGSTYYLGALVDANKDVAESNELNNAPYFSTQITVNRNIELHFVTDPSGAPASIGNGLNFNLSNNVINSGSTVTSGPVTVRFYLSKDSIISTADTLIGSRSISSLAAGASSSVSTKLTIPVGLAPGDYKLGAIIDPTNTLTETNEGNNIWATGPSLSVFRNQDVTVTSVTPLTITGLKPGYNMDVSSTISNIGSTYTSGSVLTRFYLSVDPIVTTADTLIGSRTLSAMAPGAPSTATSSTQIPLDLSPGIYYFGAITDPVNTLAESNESNNTKTNGTITVNP